MPRSGPEHVKAFRLIDWNSTLALTHSKQGAQREAGRFKGSIPRGPAVLRAAVLWANGVAPSLCGHNEESSLNNHILLRRTWSIWLITTKHYGKSKNSHEPRKPWVAENCAWGDKNQKNNNLRRVSSWDQGPPTVPTTPHVDSASWNTPTLIPERESVLWNVELENCHLKRRDPVQTGSLWSHKQKACTHRQKAKSPGLPAGVSSSAQHTLTLLLLDWEEREGKEDLLKAKLTQLLYFYECLWTTFNGVNNPPSLDATFIPKTSLN